ncbi:phage Gp37/Gp68 family protein [Cupriavidus basilensis]|jgi:protein gp37|uniref:phage Gp37/Gp68 family protein n=1 Tax=Cupriavidus basilensis TaxID=68895 RepID=UPI0020A6AFCF|nr:phage Gp37/Gp68 family protein [Cupriavidus basilensis]MCP3024614.1 phage Gp37/Gp68 family protein [Cupriavidus basilensis]
MSESTKIEWCDSTVNPWIGCQAVSPGCANCYAADWAKRYRRDFAQRTRTAPATWRQPVRWNAQHEDFFAAHGRRRRVFCASLADVFDNAVPPSWRVDLLQLIADTPNLDWLLLTKRIGNAHGMLDEALGELSHGLTAWADVPWPNVWLGATICNQEEADRDIPKLLAVPARVRFLSMEPLLGPVDLRMWMRAAWRGSLPIDWVIAGGESGPGARPMHPDWVRSLRDQCADAGVPFLFKQHGEWAPGSGDFGAGRFVTAAVARDGRVAPGGYEAAAYPRGAASADGWAMVHRAGKKAAGRRLDGLQHEGFPSANPPQEGSN